MPIAAVRKETLTGTTFELVVHPRLFQVKRNEETGVTSLSFEWDQLLSIDGNVRFKDRAQTGTIVRDLNAISTIAPAYAGETDPTTGADLTQITLGGVMKILLSAFDRAYVQEVT